MLQPGVTTYAIADFLEWQASRQLILVPKFQRRSVWQPKAKSFLVDTVLRGMPMPPIYIRQLIDARTGRAVREVVDGQQRIRTLLEFIAGEFPVLQVHNSQYGGSVYADLDEEAKRAFLNYRLPVNLLADVTDAEVLALFTRINTYTVPLNAQELRNAEFFGVFKQLVYDLAHEHYAFWKNNRVLTDLKIARMGDAELVSVLLATMIDGIGETKSGDLKRLYSRFDDDMPEAARLRGEFSSVIDAIGQTLGQSLSETKFRQGPLFFSLFTFFYDALFGLPGSQRPRLRLDANGRASLAGKITALDMQIKNPQGADPGFVAFQEAAARATADPLKRSTRHEYLWSRLGA